MYSVGIRELKAHLGKVLQRVREDGEAVEITYNPELGRRAVTQLQQLPVLRLVSVDHRLGLLATGLAVELRLRSADAVYVATAAQLGIPLVSWDSEQRDRAGIRVTVLTP